jgi:hypothetical protein
MLIKVSEDSVFSRLVANCCKPGTSKASVTDDAKTADMDSEIVSLYLTVAGDSLGGYITLLTFGLDIPSTPR